MKKSSVLFAVMAAANVMPVNAAVVELFDWGANIEGSTACKFGTPCDSANLAALPATVDASLFDFTTGLGTISYTITGAGDHHASLYVDHQINFDGTLESFINEFGAANGTPAGTPCDDPDQSWEIDEPFFFGDIFNPNFLTSDNVIGSQLDGTNSLPAGSEEDVSMALAWDFNLGAGIGAGETAVVDFLISEVAPTTGFYLSLTDAGTNESIYFSSTLDIQPNPVPVPGALLLFGSGLVGLMGTCLRRKSQKA